MPNSPSQAPDHGSPAHDSAGDRLDAWLKHVEHVSVRRATVERLILSNGNGPWVYANRLVMKTRDIGVPATARLALNLGRRKLRERLR